MEINNGIGQRDPISMSSYIFYNSDLLELLWLLTCMEYMDDIMLISIGEDFYETTKELKETMEAREGGLQWATEHNSNFKISKLAVMHCIQK
jgi:hypothetical protein